MNIKNKFIHSVNENINLKKKLNSKKNVDLISKVVERIYSTIIDNKKIMTCGNGGSAADAQHLAAEFVVRLNPNNNRKALPMISLALDTSTITACGNDYNFNDIFSRSLEAIGQKGDLLFVISTSGMSKNILKVLKKAKKMKINSVALLGTGGGKAKSLSDFSLVVPSNNTARIQEVHIFLGHFILNCVEEKILRKKND
jgi:D-sedoheptulose 7-phosphate isomerase